MKGCGSRGEVNWRSGVVAGKISKGEVKGKSWKEKLMEKYWKVYRWGIKEEVEEIGVMGGGEKKF